jgi:tetratricopeptide (TPR) repeat protein
MEELEMIMRYLDGEVIGEDKLLFEYELSINSTLREKFRLVKDVDKVLADEELFSFVGKLNKAHMLHNALESDDSTLDVQLPRESSKVVFLKSWKFMAAASVTLLFAISSISYLYLSNSPTDSLFNEYYQHYDAAMVTRSISPAESGDLVMAIQDYDKSNYKAAIVKFEKIIQADATNTAARFFVGVSYIEVKNYTKAIENLQYVINKNDTAFVEHAQWYLALCFVKNNQKGDALPLLNKIASSSNYYKPQAMDILKKLK